jgi:hypothetical protein
MMDLPTAGSQSSWSVGVTRAGAALVVMVRSSDPESVGLQRNFTA